MPGTQISGSRALKQTTDTERERRSFPRHRRRKKETTNRRARCAEHQKKTRPCAKGLPEHTESPQLRPDPEKLALSSTPLEGRGSTRATSDSDCCRGNHRRLFEEVPWGNFDRERSVDIGTLPGSGSHESGRRRERKQLTEREDAKQTEDTEAGEKAEREENGVVKEDTERSDDGREQRGKWSTEKDATTEAEADSESPGEEPNPRRPRHIPGGTWLQKV
ncbi:hypothetical protein NDU88_004910 [Pleurodeles waltl]|uniref:Uncharacterized protein n=1 Tax=Pleurodeles waltl TaxID=8319 RepID=A0AAV7MHX9_PLEWA|nr:hypothetical protein NDU88_004910 [Pleurodeles waltl]